MADLREFLINNSFIFKDDIRISGLIEIFKILKASPNVSITLDHPLNLGSIKTIREYYVGMQVCYFKETDPREYQQPALELFAKIYDSIDLAINQKLLLYNPNRIFKFFNPYIYKINLNLPIYDNVIKQIINSKCEEDPVFTRPEITTFKYLYEFNDILITKRICIENYTNGSTLYDCIPSNCLITQNEFITSKYLIIEIVTLEEEVENIRINDLFSNIHDPQDNEFELIGIGFKSGGQGGGHWWYYSKIGIEWFRIDDLDNTIDITTQANITSEAIQPGYRISFVLYRRTNKNYNRIPVYDNLNDLNNHVLDCMDSYIESNNLNTDEYIKILVYYTNIVNKNLNNQHNLKICNIIDRLNQKIKSNINKMV
jgi:hypothetical protein